MLVIERSDPYVKRRIIRKGTPFSEFLCLVKDYFFPTTNTLLHEKKVHGFLYIGIHFGKLLHRQGKISRGWGGVCECIVIETELSIIRISTSVRSHRDYEIPY